MMAVIYCGAHDSVESEVFGLDARGRRVTAALEAADPVHVEGGVAEDLIARGDFLPFKPEPPRRPVQKTKE